MLTQLPSFSNLSNTNFISNFTDFEKIVPINQKQMGEFLLLNKIGQIMCICQCSLTSRAVWKRPQDHTPCFLNSEPSAAWDPLLNTNSFTQTLFFQDLLLSFSWQEVLFLNPISYESQSPPHNGQRCLSQATSLTIWNYSSDCVVLQYLIITLLKMLSFKNVIYFDVKYCDLS